MLHVSSCDISHIALALVTYLLLIASALALSECFVVLEVDESDFSVFLFAK